MGRKKVAHTLVYKVRETLSSRPRMLVTTTIFYPLTSSSPFLVSRFYYCRRKILDPSPRPRRHLWMTLKVPYRHSNIQPSHPHFTFRRSVSTLLLLPYCAMSDDAAANMEIG